MSSSSFQVQAATLPDILAGHDVLAQAKTGTGKTMGFLIPSIQRLLSQKTQPQGISILVISPTRELAQQITVEAKKLLDNLGNASLGVLDVVGGTKIHKDIATLKSKRIDVLVATPGRLNDLIENSDLKQRLSGLSECGSCISFCLLTSATLVLDEADRLLDQGFRPELNRIVASLPDRQHVDRQTLLFSATMPSGVESMASVVLKPEHKFISTLKEEDQNVHQHVRQEVIVVSNEDVMPSTLGVLLNEAKRNPNYKSEPIAPHSCRLLIPVIVFLPTARAAALFHDVFAELKLFPVFEIHSRLSQKQREKVTELFRNTTKGVLCSSDVTARGIDIKDVTLVVQANLPSNSEQCKCDLIHVGPVTDLRYSPPGSYRTCGSRRSRCPHPRRL